MTASESYASNADTLYEPDGHELPVGFHLNQEVFVHRCISAIYAYASQADWQSIRAAETDIGETLLGFDSWSVFLSS